MHAHMHALPSLALLHTIDFGKLRGMQWWHSPWMSASFLHSIILCIVSASVCVLVKGEDMHMAVYNELGDVPRI